MNEPTKIKTKREHRVETGAIQFDDDWKGLFIRGDDCIQLISCLDSILNDPKIRLSWWDKDYFESLKRNILDDVLSWNKETYGHNS